MAGAARPSTPCFGLVKGVDADLRRRDGAARPESRCNRALVLLAFGGLSHLLVMFKHGQIFRRERPQLSILAGFRLHSEIGHVRFMVLHPVPDIGRIERMVLQVAELPLGCLIFGVQFARKFKILLFGDIRRRLVGLLCGR
jgi:hypothetical protein